jgi:ornithine carbamoyltransferase
LPNNFLSVNDWNSTEHEDFLFLTDTIKQGNYNSILKNKNFALVFEKASLRTRVSFEVAIKKFGGNAIYLSENDIGLGKRESITHVAKNLDRWVDGIIARVYQHSTLINFTKNTNINIINALSDLEHPCQALADIYTIYKKFGTLNNINFCYIGDGNNVASSLSLLCGHLGINFTYSSPTKYQIPQFIFDQSRNLSEKKESRMNWEENPDLAVKNADIIYTDKWVSMGMEDESEIRIKDFKNYQVNKKLISLAKNEVFIMHDMPAKEGEEIETGILDSSISLAFEQAENRMHSQAALLYKLYS